MRFYALCLILFTGIPALATSECSTVTNVASGRPVSITVTGNDGTLVYEGESPADVTDGSRAYTDPSLRQEDGCVGYCNSTEGQSMTVNVVIDLQVDCDITTIRYNTGDTAHADTWAADSMTTAFGTTKVNPGLPGTGAWTTHYGTLTASTVTVTLTKKNTGTNRDWLFIGEIEVYGTEVEPPPPAPVILPVIYLPQHFSDAYCTSGGEGSCGPASLSMCAAYALGRTPVSNDIKAVWSYIDGYSSIYNYECGNDLNGTSLTQLRNAARGWPFGLSNVSYVSISTLQTIRDEIDAGRPMVVHVVCGHLSNRPYSWAKGHYVAAIGYDTDNIICHDPLNTSGMQIYYDNDEMLAAILDDCSGTCNTGGLRYFYQ